MKKLIMEKPFSILCLNDKVVVCFSVAIIQYNDIFIAELKANFYDDLMIKSVIKNILNVEELFNELSIFLSQYF